MHYDIIATLGPSSAIPDIWQALLAAGATAFRLNTSHLTLPQLAHWLDRLDPFLATQQPWPALVLDLQGSKWRLGDFAPRTRLCRHNRSPRCPARAPSRFLPGSGTVQRGHRVERCEAQARA